VQSAPRACTPARRRDRGSKARAAGAEGITRPAQAACGCGSPSGSAVRAEGRGDPRPVPDLPGLHPCRARAEPLAPNRKRASVPQRSEGQSAVARPVKKAPQEGQHSAASWRDPGPSASGERLNRATTCCAMGLKLTDRDVSRLGSRKPGGGATRATANNFMWVSLLSGLHICKSLRARRRSSPTVSSDPGVRRCAGGAT